MEKTLAVKVPKNVAVNPVAVAVAMNKLHVELRKDLTLLFMAEDGQYVEKACTECMEVVAIACSLLQFAGATETPEYRVMHATQNVLLEVAQNKFKWRTRYAVAIDEGVKRGLAVVKAADPYSVRRAWTLLHTKVDVGPRHK